MKKTKITFDSLDTLIKNKGYSYAEFSRKINVSTQRLNNWKARGIVPTSMVQELSDFFGVSMTELFTPKNNAYDTKKTINTNIEPIELTSIAVPLINWVQAGAWSDIATNYHAEQYYPCPEKHSDHTFALTVCGESMSPDFINGEIIYVDPQVEPKNGSCVVVQQNGNSEATFKQLVLDGSTRYLKALNPHWPEQFIKMLPDAVICGVVIGSYRKRN